MSLQSPLGVTQGAAVELRTPALGASTSARSRAGVLALAALLVGAAVISTSAAHTDALLPESVRPLPTSLTGPFGNAGLSLGAGGSIALLALIFASYVIVVHSAERLSGRTVLMCIAAVHAVVLLAPPLLSTDLFSYQLYGRMGALYGANPYVAGPHAVALDQVYPYIGWKWAYTPTVYGPLFTWISYLLAPLSIAASALAYKAIAAVASLATVALVWNCARLRGIDPVKAAALVGLNPLVFLYGVGGGHNDLLMLTALAAGVYLLLLQRGRAAGGTIVAAAAIKLSAALLLPFALAGRHARERRDVLLGAGMVAALVAAVAVAWFGAGPLHLLLTVGKVQSEGDWHSIPGLLATRLGLGTIGRLAGLVLAAAFLAALCWLLRRVWRGELDWIDAAAWSTAALLVTASSLLPWYVAWLMPLAALAHDRRLWRVAIVMTGAVQAIAMLGYLPHLPTS